MAPVVSRSPRGWRVALVVVGLILAPAAARAQRGWDGAQIISAIVPFVADARVAVDDSGVVTAAWIEASQQFVVRATRRSPAGGWTSPVALSAPRSGGADLALAAATSGDVLVVWTTELGIFTSRYSHDTAAWGQETLVASRPYAHAPAVAVDTAGNAQVMWHLDGAARVEGVRYDAAAGTWGPVRDFGSGVQPLIGMDGAGNVLAVWSDLGATTSTVSFSRYMVATGLWSPPAVVDSAPFAGAGALSIIPDGTAVLLWATAGASLTNYAVKAGFFLPVAGSWGGVTTVTTSAITDAAVVFGTADAVVVWTEAQGVMFRRYDLVGGNWTIAQPISPASADTIDVAADALGGVVAVWRTDDGRVSGSRYSHGTNAWTPGFPLSTPGLSTWQPEVVAAPTGSASVVWMAGENPMAVQASQWHATLTPPPVVDVMPGAGALTVAFTPTSPALAEFTAQNIEYSTDGGATWTLRAPASAASPVVITDLADFVASSLRLRLVNVAGAGLASPPLVATPGVGSIVPTDLVATAIAGNTVTLAWMPPAVGVMPSGYVIEGGLAPGQVLGQVVTGGTGSAFTFSAPTGAFFVRVHALTPLPGGRSGPSNEIRILVNVPAPPSPPRDLLGLVNGSSIALSWANTFAGGAPTGVSLVASGPVTATLPLGLTETFQFAGVPPGTYTLSVVATNATGQSAPSNAIVLTFPGSCSGPPGTPTRLVAQVTGGAVSVSWGPPQSAAAATQYRLDVSGAFSGRFVVPGREIGGRVPPGVYTFSVVALNPCGASTATAPLTIAVP